MNAAGEGNTDQEATLPGLFGRYIRVFTAPDVLFEGLRSRPAWAGATLLGGCLLVAGTVLIPPELTLAMLREQGRDLPPGFEDQMALFRYGFAVAGFVSWWIRVAFIAGVVTVVFSFLLGHEGSYRQYLAVVAHANLILATSAVLLLPLRIFAEDLQIRLSLGTFATFLEPGYMLRFLSLLDLFGLWGWILVGLGAATIGRKESWAGGSALILVIPITVAAIIAIFTG